MSISIVVVGGGRVGAHLASLLLSNGHSVVMIESNGAEIARLRQMLAGTTVLEGSGTDPATLEAAQLRNAQVLAAVTGSDETNLVATSLAKFEFHVERTIARVKDPKNAWMFGAVMGVDVAVNQADLMSHLIAEEMSLSDMMTLLKFTRGKFSLVEEKVHDRSQAAGKAIRDLELPVESLLTGIIRRGELILPRGNTILEAGDEVLAVVHSSHLGELASLLGPSDDQDSNTDLSHPFG